MADKHPPYDYGVPAGVDEKTSGSNPYTVPEAPTSPVPSSTPVTLKRGKS